MNFDVIQTSNQKIKTPKSCGVELCVKREDLLHPFVSGNKYRKLKYNLKEAKHLGFNTILTFGGAFSNHIAAVAYAGFTAGFKTIGIIRGEELANKTNNATLKFAKKHGMCFKFVSRQAYRDKSSQYFIEKLRIAFGDFYLIPEGGTNMLAVKGCQEILKKEDNIYNTICCAVGTGGTISGLINCSQPSQQVLGFPALKGTFLNEDITKFVTKTNWRLCNQYHFGGYAKINLKLIEFINNFKTENNIQLDPIYTGKMLFGIIDLIKQGYFLKGTKILAIHTGGLQGISGINARLKQKKLPLINY